VPAPRDEKREVILEIERHLMRVGEKDWREVRAKYPGVPESTFFRYVAEAKRKLADPQLVEEARQKLTERAAATPAEVKLTAAAACLPVAPSPDFIAKSGPKGIVSIDLLEKFELLYADAVKLRDYSLNEEDKIRNPLYFTQSITSRDRILNTALSAMRAIWDLRRMQNLYDAIIEEIGRVSPELQQAVVERLAELDARHGLSFDART
jgi:hypothetical protein